MNNFSKNFFEKNKEINLDTIVDKSLKFKMEFNIKYYLISKNESELIKNKILSVIGFIPACKIPVTIFYVLLKLH